MTHELSPSGMANPTVQLPLADRALRVAAMKSTAKTDQLDLLDSLMEA